MHSHHIIYTMLVQKQQELLTIDPCDADSLEDSHEEKTHAAGRVVVKQLEDIHAALRGERQGLGHIYVRIIHCALQDRLKLHGDHSEEL